MPKILEPFCMSYLGQEAAVVQDHLVAEDRNRKDHRSLRDEYANEYDCEYGNECDVEPGPPTGSSSPIAFEPSDRASLGVLKSTHWSTSQSDISTGSRNKSRITKNQQSTITTSESPVCQWSECSAVYNARTTPGTSATVSLDSGHNMQTHFSPNKV